MRLDKLLIATTLTIVLALIWASAFYPNTFLMNFANTSSSYMGIRFMIAALMVALLFTSPPRAKWLRLTIGAAAIALFYVSISEVFNYNLHLIDAFIFMELSIIFGIEALEPSTRSIYIRKSDSFSEKIPVKVG